MPNLIVNYDGSITTIPQQLVYPKTAAEIQDVLRDTARYPSPVRAMGSNHSLTPCASSDGTVLNMSQMSGGVDIDEANQTFTAQAGLQFIDASKLLQSHGLQFMTNIEIGNMTLGSAACCQTKDALDGIEYGQVCSYVTKIKWVKPDGSLDEVSDDNPDLLRKVRSSYGLCGVVYEVTLRVKPIEAIHLTYLPRPVEELTEAEVDTLLKSSEGLICWTVGRTCVFQCRHRIDHPGILESLFAAARRTMWSHTAAHAGHFIDQFISDKRLRDAAQLGLFEAEKFLYFTLGLVGGITLLAPDKIIDYRGTPASDRYAFSFWAFPRAQWLQTLLKYLDFADQHFKTTGFRCNMPLGSYRIREDDNSLLSYTKNGEIISIDPIHAVADDAAAWYHFLHRFNEFAYDHNGIPLLNQSPFVERKHVEQAYGSRWSEFSKWVKDMDPNGRMLNTFFADLLS